MSLKQKAVKGVIWSVLEGWGRQAVAFLVFSCLARLLDPETFGLVALSSVFLAFVQVFLDQGFSTAIIQRQELDPEHLDTAFWTNIIIGSLMTLLGIFCSGLVAAFFKEPQIAPVVRWLSVNFFLISLSGVQAAIFTRNLAFKALALRSIVAVLVGGAVGITMAFLGYGVWSLVAQQISNNLAQVVVLWSASSWRPGFNVSKQHFQELFSFGINVLGIKVLEFVNRYSDNLLIGYFLGPIALGYYTVAYRVLLIMTQILTGVTSRVTLPAFSKLQQEPEKVRRAFYTVTQFTSLIAFPAFIGMAALAPELVPVLFGSQWLPSVPVMQILSLIGIVHSVGYFNSNVMLALGKPTWKLGVNLMNAIANVIGFLVAVQWGVVAVAAAYTVRGYALLPVPIWAIYKLIGLNVKKYFAQFLAPLLASLVMIVAIFAFRFVLGDSVGITLRLALQILSGAAAYLGSLCVISPSLFSQMLNTTQTALSRKKRHESKAK